MAKRARLWLGVPVSMPARETCHGAKRAGVSTHSSGIRQCRSSHGVRTQSTGITVVLHQSTLSCKSAHRDGKGRRASGLIREERFSRISKAITQPASRQQRAKYRRFAESRSLMMRTDEFPIRTGCFSFCSIYATTPLLTSTQSKAGRTCQCRC